MWTAFHTPHALGENCSDNNLCQLGLVCSGNGPTCLALPASGGTCGPDSNYLCGDLREYCNSPAIGSTGSCVPRLAPGTACALPAGPPGGDPCQHDGRCTGSVCTTYTGTVGTACNGSCSYGLECIGETCAGHGPGILCTTP
jgi:hypothetical protein